MRHQRPAGFFGSPPLRCSCCGVLERQSGCVRGFPCQCFNALSMCQRCHKCNEHCVCTDEQKAEHARRVRQRLGLIKIARISEELGLYDD